MAQDGAYCRALDWYYDHEGPLPLKPAVYGELRCMGKACRGAVDVVLAKYFTETTEGYLHARCDEEIKRYRERSESAKRSINARWDKRNTNVSETNNEGITSQNQNQNQNQEKGLNPPTPQPRRAPRSVAPLPDWIPPDSWERWRKHRGQKLTPQAIDMQVRKLDGLRAEGHNPATVIDLAIESGWATFYAPKPQPVSQQQRPGLSTLGSQTVNALGAWLDGEERRGNGTTGS